jgi:hypothetical protein
VPNASLVQSILTGCSSKRAARNLDLEGVERVR